MITFVPIFTLKSIHAMQLQHDSSLPENTKVHLWLPICKTEHLIMVEINEALEIEKKVHSKMSWDFHRMFGVEPKLSLPVNLLALGRYLLAVWMNGRKKGVNF